MTPWNQSRLSIHTFIIGHRGGKQIGGIVYVHDRVSGGSRFGTGTTTRELSEAGHGVYLAEDSLSGTLFGKL